MPNYPKVLTSEVCSQTQLVSQTAMTVDSLTLSSEVSTRKRFCSNEHSVCNLNSGAAACDLGGSNEHLVRVGVVSDSAQIKLGASYESQVCGIRWHVPIDTEQESKFAKTCLACQDGSDNISFEVSNEAQSCTAPTPSRALATSSKMRSNSAHPPSEDITVDPASALYVRICSLRGSADPSTCIIHPQCRAVRYLSFLEVHLLLNAVKPSRISNFVVTENLYSLCEAVYQQTGNLDERVPIPVCVSCVGATRREKNGRSAQLRMRSRPVTSGNLFDIASGIFQRWSHSATINKQTLQSSKQQQNQTSVGGGDEEEWHDAEETVQFSQVLSEVVAKVVEVLPPGEQPRSPAEIIESYLSISGCNTQCSLEEILEKAKEPFKHKQFFLELFSQRIIPQSFNINPIISLLDSKLKTMKIVLNIAQITQIVTNIVTLIAILKEEWGNCSPLKTLAVVANVLSLIVGIFLIFKINFDSQLTEFYENMTAAIFGMPLPNELPTMDGVSESEMATCVGSLTQESNDLEELSMGVTESYSTLRKHFSMPTKGDPVTMAVNGISWIVSLAAIFSIRAMGVDIRTATSYLTFLKYGRELQQNLSRDINDIQRWVREIWTKPKETQFNLLNNRISRCEYLLQTSDIDIVCDPSQLFEFEHLVRTNPEVLACPQIDEGLKTLKSTLSVLHIKMVERGLAIQDLAKARGLRPVPVALHLWSTVGGVGKSSFVTNKVVPEIHRVVGSTPGSETWLKLSTENKYFPLTGERSKICVVDEFLTLQDLDPVLAHINGMVSETPYFLDSAFVKNQSFSAEFLALMSNIPGCSLTTHQLNMNPSACIAMWGRLIQFQVVNINRPPNQSSLEREFEHAKDFSDLRFLPGQYLPEHGKRPSTEGAVPIYPQEVQCQLDHAIQTWVPKQLNGKWVFTADELIQYLSVRIRSNQLMFHERLQERRNELVSEMSLITKTKVVQLNKPVLPEMESWNDLPQIEQDSRVNWRAALFTQCIRDLYTNPLECDINLTNLSRYIHGQYSQAIMKRISGFDFDKLSFSSHDLGNVFSLAIAAKINVVFEGKIYIEVNPSYSCCYISFQNRQWSIRHDVPMSEVNPSETSSVQTSHRHVSMGGSQSTYMREDYHLMRPDVTTTSQANELLPLINEAITDSTLSDSDREAIALRLFEMIQDQPEQQMSNDEEQEVQRLRDRIAHLEAQTAALPTPTLLRPLNQSHPKFAIYISGLSGAGKSYYARQVSETLSLTLGMPIINADTAWWDQVTPQVIQSLRMRPHIILSDDSCFTRHYIAVYDNCHHKTMFINTSNERLVPLQWYNKISFDKDTRGWMQFVLSRVKRIFKDIVTFDKSGKEKLDQFPEGLVRRIGVSGCIFHKESIIDLSPKCNFTIQMNGARPAIMNGTKAEWQSPSQCLDEIFKAYNLFLEDIGEIKFQNVTSFEEVQIQLGNKFRRPDIHIRARSFDQLQGMLLNHSTIFQNYTNKLKEGNMIFVHPEFVKDPRLSITNPDSFLISVKGTMTVADLVEQGIKMYRKVQMSSYSPAIRIQCGNYDIYCYDMVIYVNTDSYESSIVPEKTENTMILHTTQGIIEISYEQLWDIVKPGSEYINNGLPLWALHWVRSNANDIIDWPELLYYKQQYRKTEQLRLWLEKQSTPWSVVWENVQKSPYWNVLKIATAISGLIAVFSSLYLCIKPAPKPETNIILIDQYDIDFEDEDFVDALEELEEELDIEIPSESLERLVNKMRLIDKQESGPDLKQKGKKNRRKAAKNFRRKGGFGGRRHKGAFTYQGKEQQMVRGLPKIGAPIDRPSHTNLIEAISKKIESNMVQIMVSGKECAYGLVLGGRDILAPAHYLPRSWKEQKFSEMDQFTVRYIERGTLYTRILPIKPVVLRRDLELMLFRVPSEEKQWQEFASIRNYIVTIDDLDALHTGFLMVHSGMAVDRHHCSIHLIMETPTNLLAGDIKLKDRVQISWATPMCTTGPGYCGQPYLAIETKNERMLCAMHIAAGNQFAYGALLTQEIINSLYDDDIQQENDDMMIITTTGILEYMDDETYEDFPDFPWMLEYSSSTGFPVYLPTMYEPIFDEIKPRYKIPISMRDCKFVKPLGYIPKFDSNKNIKLKKSKGEFCDIAEAFGVSVCQHPSITSLSRAPLKLRVEVHDAQGEVRGESIYWAQLAKLLENDTFDMSTIPLMEEAMHYLTPKWEAYYGKFPFRLLNDFEIRNGIQYGPYKGHTEGLDRSSSVGLPMSALDKTSTKAAYLDLMETDDHIIKVWNQKPHTARFLEHVDQMIDFIKVGYMPITTFKASMKAELIDKNEDKARLFCASGMDLQYVSTMFFGCFAAAVKYWHPIMECQVGVDPIRTLSAVWNRMIQVDGSCMCVDFSRWDKTLPLQLTQVIQKFIVELILSKFEYSKVDPWTPEQMKRGLNIIFTANIMPIINVEGVQIFTLRGLPSGSYFTTWLNSFTNSLLSATVILKWQKDYDFRIIRNSSEWHENWVEVNYGDDKAVRLSQELIDAGMCYSVFRNYVMKMFGMIVTPPSKTGSAQETVPLEGVEFISRQPHHLNGGVWLNRLKKISFRGLWHWLSTRGDREENAIQNLDTIMLEACLWGRSEYELHYRIAKATRTEALKHGWFKYIQKLAVLPKYESALDSLERELQSSIALCSSPAFGIVERECSSGSPEKPRNSENIIVQGPEIFSKLNVVTTIQSEIEKQEVVQLKNTTDKQRVTSDFCTAEEAIPSFPMLPDRYRDTPFAGDLFKTMLWLHMQFALRAINLKQKAVVVYSSSEDYAYLVKNAEEERESGFTLVKIEELGEISYFVWSLSIQLAGGSIVEKKLLNVLPDICAHMTKTLPKGKAFVFYVKKDRKTEKVQRIYVTTRPLPTPFQVTTLLPEERTINTVAETKTTISMSGAKEAQTGSSMPQAVGSRAPTGDAQAAPAAPSDINAQVSNQQNNGALPFGNLPAMNRLNEGGKLIQITEAACQNWYQVYANGGPLINVPVSTAPGTILFKANIRDLFNVPMELWTLIHERGYRDVELLVNFIGTPTWAGNVLVAVLPTDIPSGSSQDIDNYIRTYAYEQKPLSSNGTQIIRLRRLINEAQTNVAWDVEGQQVSGPYVVIQLATSYEQALANENTAFQIQLLSRFGPDASFGGLNFTNISKMIAAVKNPSGGGGGSTGVAPPLANTAGLTMEDFMKVVLGQTLIDTPSLIVNGNYFLEEERDTNVVLTKLSGRGYNIINPSYAWPKMIMAGGSDTSRVLVGPDGLPHFTDHYDRINFVGGWKTNVSSPGITGVAFATRCGFSKQMAAFLNDQISESGTIRRVLYATASYQANRTDGDGYTPITWPYNDVISSIPNRLAAEGWAVTYLTTTPRVRWTVDPNGSWNETNRFIEFRAEKNGIVDEVRAVQVVGEIPSGYTPGNSLIISIEDVPNTDPETVLAQARGFTLSEGLFRFEIADKVRPIMSTSTIPAASRLINAALLKFMKESTPEEYFTVIEVWNMVVGRKVFSLLYSGSFDTILIQFPPNSGVTYAIFNGAALSQLQIRSITTINKTASLPSSDPSVWTSIHVTGNNLAAIQSALQLVSLRNSVKVQRKQMLTQAMRELVRETMLEHEEQKNLKLLKRKMMASRVCLEAEGTSKESQQGIPNLNEKPRQIQVGKAWQQDRELALSIMTGGLGKGVSSAGGSLPGLSAARTSQPQMAVRTESKGGKLPGMATSPPTPSGYKTPQWQNRDGLRRVMIGDYDSNLASNKQFSKGMFNETKPHDNYVPAEAVNQSVVNRFRLSDSENTVKVYNQQKEAGKPVTQQTIQADVHVDAENGGQSQKQQKPTRKFGWERKTENWLARNSAKQPQGGVLSSAVEGGINAGLAEQQHGHNKEMLDAYYDKLTAQQKQEFLNQIELMEKNGTITSEHMKEQFGFDKELAQQQINHEKELQESEQEHEAGMQEDTQSHDKEMLEIEEAQKIAAEQRDLRAKGIMTAGIAGLSASSPSNTTTISSGIK